jgi:hypothetical protein
MIKKIILAAGMAVLVGAYPALAQAAGDQQRIEMPVIINGQQTQGVLVVQGGSVQTYSCPDPHRYVTANQAESGWACFEQSTGVWLLHAEPPVQATVPQQQSTTLYSSPATVYAPYYSSSYYYPYYPYGYYPYSYYPYTYYPYSYSYPFIGPRYGIGFGFGFGYRAPIIGNRLGIGRYPYTFSRPFGGFRGGGGVVVHRGGRR